MQRKLQKGNILIAIVINSFNIKILDLITSQFKENLVKSKSAISDTLTYRPIKAKFN